MALTLIPRPSTAAEPVTEILHGASVTDPYRWLEDPSSPRTRTWLQEQIAYARAYLDAIPCRERIRKRVAELLAIEGTSAPLKVGNRYFFLKRNACQEQPVITMREGLTGVDIPLIDPADRHEGSATTVGILSVSQNGTLLAYAVRHSGEDTLAVEIFDVSRRTLLPDRLPNGYHGGLVFSPDSRGFYYVHNSVESSSFDNQALRSHTFGTRPEEDLETFFAGKDPRLRLLLHPSPDGTKMCLYKLLINAVKTTDVYVQDLTTVEPPKLVVDQIEGRFYAFLSKNQLLALTDWKSAKGRIVAIDLDRPERDNWRDVVPESQACLESFAVSAERIFVAYSENAVTRIDIFDNSGRAQGTIPCPPLGTAQPLQGDPNSDEVFYSFTSFSQPPSVYRYDSRNGHQELWTQNEVPFDRSSVEVEQIRYPSKDGTRIPMFLISEKGRVRSGLLPVFLTGYGGFGISLTPKFTAYATFLIEQGFLVAIANLRGGSEFGEEWHVAAKRHNRQTAFDDFEAAAEWLLAQGLAAPGRIAIGGGSNAGLLVGAALTQRPHLFRAVICLGPLLDMLRYHKFDQAHLSVEEYGSAENQEDFQYLRAYSPYHRVKDGVAYPAVMLISGDADTRCNPMHARKMAARLQAATSSGHPILLDYRPTWGHMPVQPLSNRIEALTDRLAFLCHELGVNV
jgi:prolyl oligopeptidase